VNYPRLRHCVRALVVDENERVLLCRGDFNGLPVWGAPGGGIEAGESQVVALRRELLEEVGLSLTEDPPHVWHQVVEPPVNPEFDVIINDYYLVRTMRFEPVGTFSQAELAEEFLELRWWPLAQIAEHSGEDVFTPRSIALLLESLLRDGIPEFPIDVGN
jgi:8-oxo-dGTP diphosphatase